jgi:hypothetical protein
MIINWWTAIGGFALALSLMAAEPGVKAQFIGGTLAGVSAKSSLHIDLTGTAALRLWSDKAEFSVAYAKINTIEYGQTVSRRYAAAVLISPILLLSKSRKHFVTIGYSDAAGQQQALVFRVDKGDIRSLLASLEARSGRRVEYQDDEARKGGKG